MSDRIEVEGNAWNELTVYDREAATKLVISRGFLVTNVSEKRKPSDPMIAVEIHHGDEEMKSFYISFEEAVDIFKHIQVLFKEHDENGDFNE